MAVPSAQPPNESTPARLAASSSAAAGLGGVIATTQHVLGRAGVLRGAKLLLQVNQKDGFDCQSCAWPSPDGERHVFEFCENGAKAVADEATTKKIGRE